LRLAGHQPFLASRLRSFDGFGDPIRQTRVARIGYRLVDRLLWHWRRHPGEAPALWFTYHLYHKAPDHLGPVISTALGIPYVIAEASFAPKQTGGRWSIGQVAVERALRRADAVIGLNPADQAGVLPLIGDQRHWFAMLPFLDASRYPDHERKVSVPFRLIAVAMMRPGDKTDSYRVLGEALAGLLDLSWTLDIVGDGPARPEIAHFLAPLGARVRYLGALSPDDIPPALGSADLFVWPAINEAFCVAVLEAQAAGLPVVAGHSGGLGTIVADGSTGLLAPPGDVATFAAAVRRLLLHPPTRTAMGIAARAKILREHDLPSAAGRLDEVINGLRSARAA
jgi:glycosyltransferase involved in cell wall biosynthesis